jgi:hypothetical protein
MKNKIKNKKSFSEKKECLALTSLQPFQRWKKKLK